MEATEMLVENTESIKPGCSDSPASAPPGFLSSCLFNICLPTSPRSAEHANAVESECGSPASDSCCKQVAGDVDTIFALKSESLAAEVGFQSTHDGSSRGSPAHDTPTRKLEDAAALIEINEDEDAYFKQKLLSSEERGFTIALAESVRLASVPFLLSSAEADDSPARPSISEDTDSLPCSNSPLVLPQDSGLKTISKVPLGDVERIMQLHIERLNEYIDSEKLFMAARYHEFLRELVRYNRSFWLEFLTQLELAQNADSSSSQTYAGAVGKAECKRILELLEQLERAIVVRYTDISSSNKGKEQITKYEVMTIKTNMALSNMSFFHLEHLRLGCCSAMQHGLSIPSNALTTGGDFHLKGSCSPVSSGPGDGRGRPNSADSPIAPFFPSGAPRSPVDTAEAALGRSEELITPNTVLLMLLRGEQFATMGGNVLMSYGSHGAATENAKLPVVEEGAREAEESKGPSANKLKSGVSSLKISKRMSSTIGRKSTHRVKNLQSAETPGGRSALHGGSFNITKMGSRVLYSLTHHHHGGQHRQPVKRALPQDADSWIREKTKFLDLWYRVEKDSSISIKVRGKLPCRLFEVLAIFNETDLAGNWAPMFKYAVREEQMSRASQMVRQVFDYPVLGQKESIMYCFGVDALNECGCVMIFCYSPPETDKYFLGALVPTKGKLARVPSACLCFLLFPVSEGRQTTLELYANYVHGIRFVPNKLVAYVVKKVVRGMFVSIAKQCQSFADSEYAERVRANPEFYDWMRSTITEFCSGAGAEGAARPSDTISLASFDINEMRNE